MELKRRSAEVIQHRFVVGQTLFAPFYVARSSYEIRTLGKVMAVDGERGALVGGVWHGRTEWPLFTDGEAARVWARENQPRVPFGSD